MRKFFTRLFIAAIPGLVLSILLLASYLYYDPFSIIYHYRDYSYPFVVGNRDHISTEMFLRNYPKYHYNSFIFGSSRTLAFKPESWKRYLPSGASPYMFDASGESIYGIVIKLRYLASRHVHLDNVLLIFDRDVTFSKTTNAVGHLSVSHPLLTGQNRFAYQMIFFKAYLSMPFPQYFLDYAWSRKYKPYMKGYIEHRKMKFDTITNEQQILDQEYEITNNPKSYYESRKELFYKRPATECTDSVQRIGETALKMLEEIRDILNKNNSNYRIVLSPLYEQIKFNQDDLAILQKLFPGHVYDFSGENSFTDKVTNYYEISHFRPSVGDSILRVIYKDQGKPSLGLP
jgi:hypothetical protein